MAKNTGSGWWRESARHSLASRGIKSGRKTYAPMPTARKPLAKQPTERSTFDLMMDYEGGNLTKAEFLTLFSRLIKNGQAWSLQGFYGRQAKALIDAGLIDRQGNIQWANAGDTKEMLYAEDSDGDGVPDSEDCSPHDPNKQDYELSPTDSHKSFYRKAMVRREGNRLILRSYDTDVAYIEDGRAVVLGRYSNTTGRHIRAFLQTEGFRTGSFDQILKMYPEHPTAPAPAPTPKPETAGVEVKKPENWWE